MAASSQAAEQRPSMTHGKWSNLSRPVQPGALEVAVEPLIKAVPLGMVGGGLHVLDT